MKRSIALALVFILGCATGGVASSVAFPAARAGTTPPTWEYQCGRDMTLEQMNEAGALGWDLVTTTWDNTSRQSERCFKRPRS